MTRNFKTSFGSRGVGSDRPAKSVIRSVVGRRKSAAQKFNWLKGVGLPVLFIAPLLWFIAYGTGFFPWQGMESRTIKFKSIGTTKQGFGLGLNKFFYFRGQTVFVDYDLKRVDAGAFVIRIGKAFALGKNAGQSWRIQKPTRAKISFKIPSTGLYSIRMTGSSNNKKGYDLSYSATWGAYFPGFESR